MNQSGHQPERVDGPRLLDLPFATIFAGLGPQRDTTVERRICGLKALYRLVAGL
jgi:hypothetical protein